MVVFECCGKEFTLGKFKYKCDDIADHNGRCSVELFRVLMYDDGEIEKR